MKIKTAEANIFLFRSTGSERADQNCKKPYDISAFGRKLTAGNFFSNNTNRATIEGAYRALKNLKPALGIICSNLMFLEKTACPSGMTRADADACNRMADDFTLTLINHPSTKAALGSILKRMLVDLGRHRTTSRRVLTGEFHFSTAEKTLFAIFSIFLFAAEYLKKTFISEAITVTTQIAHLVHVMMMLMAEQIRIINCRKILNQQLMAQFCKITKFGRLISQCELLIQQFHSTFYNGLPGISFRGLPKLVIDTSEVTYNTSGAFHKWQRKENGTSGKYAATRSRIKDLEVEAQGKNQKD